MESFFGESDFVGEADFLGERDFFGDFFLLGDSDVVFLGDTAFLGDVDFLGETDVFRSRRFFGDNDCIIFANTLRRSGPSAALKDARPLLGGEPARSKRLEVHAGWSALLLRVLKLSASVRTALHSLWLCLRRFCGDIDTSARETDFAKDLRPQISALVSSLCLCKPLCNSDGQFLKK